MLHPDRYFSTDPIQRVAARDLYAGIKELPLVCPHGHIDPRLFSDPDYQFGSSTELLLVPDHYVFRMLYSHGIQLEKLGISPLIPDSIPPDPRTSWQIFADHFYLFCGTPTGSWLRDEFASLFGIEEKLTSANAQEIYTQIDAKLKTPAFKPRRMFENFNIEVLCTTDAATDTLEHHQKIRGSDWVGQILPTFRPDSVINIDTPGWHENIQKMNDVTNSSVSDYKSFITALESRRVFFKSLGATATDHAALTALTLELNSTEADAIFQRALKGQATSEDAARFTAHMLIEMARMSTEDGLVMQLHVGSYRNHNLSLFEAFGTDMGADIPITSEFTRNLRPILNRFGNDHRLTLIIFNLDESTYAREIAPLAGHYPAIKIGPPWWFNDLINGIHRYFDQIMETAGIYNTVGFNDDTRAFPSIPSRHDIWRRASCDWVAGLLVRHIIDEDDAHKMVRALVYDLAKSTYKF